MSARGGRAPSGRAVAVLALLAAGALGLLGATQPWASAALVDGRVLEVAGQQVAGGLTILALATLALALVVPIAGPVWRQLLAVLGIGLGGLTVAHAAVSLPGSGPALAARVASATGLAGTAQRTEVAVLVSTGWPVAAIIGGALAAIAGIWVLVTGRRWPVRERAARYQRTGSGLAWDAMDDGEDPTR